MQAQVGRMDLAIPMLDAALKQEPGHVEGNRIMGLAMLQNGQSQKALSHIQRAIQSAPNRPDLHSTLGSMYSWLGQIDRAIEVLEHAVELDPRSAPTHGLLATLLLQQKDLDGAEHHYREAIANNPAFAEARTNLGTLMTMTARQAEAVQILRAGARDHPNHPGLMINYCVALNYADGVEAKEIQLAHQQYGRVLAALPGQVKTQWPNSLDPARKLKIGFVSPDLFEHSVSFFVRPLIEGLDRKSFQVFVYSIGGRPDNMTRRLQQAADVWRDLPRANDQQLLDAIRADQVDILIELSGLTQGNRMPALRLRGAPVQVTYCGYPNTTGIQTIDYRVIDSLTDPAGADAMAVEKLVRLDPCFLCFSPPESAPPPEPPPSERAGFITFGSFNSIKKLTPQVLALWARLLHAVPRARLVIKSDGLNGTQARASIMTTLKKEGIPEVRFDLWEKLDGKNDHLAAYSAMDIALDTFPYNGTTTTCEALWMGVPVISLLGNLHAARVGLSLLNAIGHKDLAANTPDECIRIATELAGDARRLHDLRTTLRQRMTGSPLCDRVAFASRFGGALRQMWTSYCSR